MRLIWKVNSPQSYIEHYKTEHGYVPFWVLVNSMTFGDISKFYSFIKDQDKVIVAKSLSKNKKILSKELDNYLQMLGVYRNILAHDERFFQYQGKNTHGSPYIIKFNSYLSLKEVNSSVFALTVCLKILLRENDFNSFFNLFLKEINSLESSLHSIHINEILRRMNFIIPKYNLNSLKDIRKLLKV